MLQPEEYIKLYEEIGKGTTLTLEEQISMREYECMINDRKYGKEHTIEHEISITE